MNKEALQDKIVSLKLSQDEMAWLLSNLPLPFPMGLPPRLFPVETPMEVGQARIQSGGMSLMVRNLIQMSPENKLGLDVVLTGVIGPIAIAKRLIYTALVVGEQQTNAVYYLTPNMMLEHQLPIDGIHQMSATPSAEALATMLVNYMNLVDAAPLPVTPFDLPDDILQPILDLANAPNGEEAFNQLQKQGIDDRTSELVVLAIMERTSRGAVIVYDKAGTETSIQSVTSRVIFNSPHGSLTIENMAGAASQVVRPYGEADAYADLELWIKNAPQ